MVTYIIMRNVTTTYRFYGQQVLYFTKISVRIENVNILIIAHDSAELLFPGTKVELE